jgi:hypothetical protein
MNDHWNVLYQVSVFSADRKSKMATIAGHRLTSSPGPKGELKMCTTKNTTLYAFEPG